MSTIAESPSPIKVNPNWAEQVKVGRGRNDLGAYHRAVDVARRFFEDDRWDGRGLFILHEAYETQLRFSFLREELVEGADYEIVDDSEYRREVGS